MSLFKRNRDKDVGGADGVDDVEAVDDDATDAATTRDGDTASPAEARADGPFDAAEVDAGAREGRLDVGSLWLPLVDGMEIQLQLDEAGGQVTGALLVLGDSAVQVQAFAAPRSEGIWREVCDEIAAGITEQGGTADPGDGPFGHELLGRVPTTLPDGRSGFQPLRFTGVDGPRWMLRAVFHGAAAVDAAAAGPLEQVVRGVVVDRGRDPMGPRELLPLRVPDEAAVAPGEQPDGGTKPTEPTDEHPEGWDDLQPFQRGPEITERR